MRDGFYEAPSLAEEGFIHCSTPEQILWVADSLFRGDHDLVLLLIDTQRVAAELVYEAPEEGEELFPHLYGPLELEAVTRVLPFEQDGGAISASGRRRLERTPQETPRPFGRRGTLVSESGAAIPAYHSASPLLTA